MDINSKVIQRYGRCEAARSESIDDRERIDVPIAMHSLFLSPSLFPDLAEITYHVRRYRAGRDANRTAFRGGTTRREERDTRARAQRVGITGSARKIRGIRSIA